VQKTGQRGHDQNEQEAGPLQDVQQVIVGASRGEDLLAESGVPEPGVLRVESDGKWVWWSNTGVGTGGAEEHAG